MVLNFYNSLTRAVEPFSPLRPPTANFYTCGPTVYDIPHIGNLRTFVTSDLVRRALTRAGFSVHQVINITDVDDKTILGARTAGLPLEDFTRKYEEIFLANLASLNILRPVALPRATEFIDHMIIMIESLIKKGSAYQAEDGIYFKLSTFPKYGQFQKPDTTDGDFALWKFHKPEDGEVVWPAPFGNGRPGWHIECSAMISATLEDSIDIHLGGTDLAFPHHENEIAQSESYSGKPLAKLWLHSAFVNINNEKMSKSLGNIIGLDQLIEKGFSPIAYRYLLLTAHYRSLINFTWESLAGATSALNKLINFAREWQEARGEGKIIDKYARAFDEALANDLNLPQALAVVWNLTKDEREKRRDKLATILNFDQVLGLGLAESSKTKEIPAEVTTLLVARESARQTENWPEADKLRQEIEKLGYDVKDTTEGAKLILK